MPHRAHLFSLRTAHAVREACVDEPYSSGRFFKDLMAGACRPLSNNHVRSSEPFFYTRTG